MRRSACAIVLLALTAPTTATVPPSTEPISADEPETIMTREALADRLAALESTNASLSTSYTVHEHYGVEASRLADLSERDQAWIANVIWTSHDHRRRLEIGKAYPGPFEEVRIVETWDGEGNARREVGVPGGRIDGGAPTNGNDSTVTLFHQSTGFWSVGGSGPLGALSEGVREGRVIEQSLDGERLTHVFSRNIKGRDVRFELTVDLTPVFRIVGFAWELPARHPDNNFASFRARLEFAVDSWMESDGMMLPHRAHRDLFLFSDVDLETGPLLAGRRTYERVDARRYVPDESTNELFHMRFDPGGWIYDTRINVAYRIGTNELVLDGTAYRTADLIWEHPGERLGEILASATIQVGPVNDAAVWVGRARSLFAGVGAMLAVLGVLLAVRIIQSRFHATAGAGS